MPRRGSRPEKIAALTTEQFERLLDGLPIQANDSDYGYLPPTQKVKHNKKAPAPAETTAALTDVWRQKFEANAERFPPSKRLLMSIHAQRFSIDEVFADGRVVGRYLSDGNYNVFAAIDHPPAGCACRESNGMRPCVHGYAFTKLVIDALKPDGQLYHRVMSQEFSTTTLDAGHFLYDVQQHALNELKSLLRMDISHSADQLPVLPTMEVERLAWEFTLSKHTSTMRPILQTTKKNGDWNRGRGVTIELLTTSNCQRSPADDRIIDLFRRSNTGLVRTVPVAQYLLQLVGQPNVYVQDTPVDVIHGDGKLTIVDSPDGWITRPLIDDQVTSEFFLVPDGLVIFDQANRRVSTFVADPGQLRCMQKLCNLIPLEGERYFNALIEQAKVLQQIVTLQLPKRVAGPLAPDQVRLVMLLRTRQGGILDYGIRLRDSRGGLHKCGHGAMIHTSQIDGRPVQLMRNAAVELELMRHWQEQLDLPKNRVEGSLDIERGLQLIDQLAQHADEIETLWDKTSVEPLRSLGTLTEQNLRVSIKRRRDWFQLEGNFQVGNKSVKLSEVMAWLNEATFSSLRTAAKSSSKTSSDSDDDTRMEGITASIQGDYIHLGEHGWAKITRELRDSLRKLTDVVHPSRGIMHFDASAAPMIRQLHTHMQVDYTQEWQNCLDRLSSAEQLTPSLPTKLKAELRDYQLAGFQWLQRLAHWGVGGVLADDMGLGKTVQTLAVIVDRATVGPTLVIAPTSVAFNWMREVERFAPHLQAQLYRQTDRDDVLKHMQPEQLIVCSYGLALRDAKKLAAVNWTTLVLDEAQAIKNSRSKTSQAITAINADWKVALTGTPVENHLGELWSLFSVISPGVFGSWEQFRDKFAAPIERDGDQERRQALGERIRPFVLRRTKGEVLRDLPARTEMNIEVELSPAERKLYDATRLLMLKEADLIVASPDVQEQRFKLLALLTRLRQLACNPRMVDETWTEESAKLQQLRDTLLELRAEGHRVLVFSQFVKHLTLIREMLDAQQITYQYLDGSTPAAQRQQQVDLFQNGNATAFLISLKAGGTGLNLTAADYVIHMDPWWNPAVEDQASDRAHRIGQTKPVLVYRIIAKDTIEEEILKLHEDKRDLVAGVLEGTHMAGQMSTKDLIALLRG